MTPDEGGAAEQASGGFVLRPHRARAAGARGVPGTCLRNAPLQKMMDFDRRDDGKACDANARFRP